MRRIISGIRTAVLMICLTAALGITVYAEETVQVSFDSLTLQSDGSASWSMSGAPENREVEYYQLRLSRLSNNHWNDSYRSVNVREDNYYNFSFGSTGVYRFMVRARFYGGGVTQWSGYSNEVTVTRDDVDHWSDGGGLDPAMDIIYNNNKNGNYGPGYALGVSSGTTPGGGPMSAGPGAVSGTSGWVEDSKGVWYRFSNGTYPSNGWHYLDNNWYYFDASGYRVTGWIWYNDHWYYCCPGGYMVTGWNNVNNKWYYMDPSGIMQTGYITINGLTYYLDPSSGARFENGYTPDGHYFDKDGVMII